MLRGLLLVQLINLAKCPRQRTIYINKYVYKSSAAQKTPQQISFWAIYLATGKDVAEPYNYNNLLMHHHLYYGLPQL